MPDQKRISYLRIALIAVGLIFVFGIYPLSKVWPAGWSWGAGHSHYLDPLAHRSLIWFTVWSSVVHGTIMGVQSFNDAGERGHLLGDVPALFLVAIILAALMPRTASAASR